VRHSGGAASRASARVLEANQSGQTFAAKVAGRAPSLVFDRFLDRIFVEIAALVLEVRGLANRSSPEPDDRCGGTAVGLIPTLCLAIPASLH
jgi:hypothetical protein